MEKGEFVCIIGHSGCGKTTILNILAGLDHATEGAAATIPLSHYLWVLRLHRWKILGFVAASVLATVIISSRLVPIYEATATIDIDRQTPPGVIGEEARGAAANDADQYLATQVKLIQSDSVLRPVAQKYKLFA